MHTRQVTTITSIIPAQPPLLQVSAADNEGNTPLHVAASFGNLVACRYLAHHGAEIDARNASGHTPLWRALAVADESLPTYGNPVSFLLDSGAEFDVRETDAAGMDIITHAITQGHHASAALLLARARARARAPAVVTIAADAWLAAATHATVSSALLKELPPQNAAAVVALRTAWRRCKERHPEGASVAANLKSGMSCRVAHLHLPPTEASGLLKRMCKSVTPHCFEGP
jgi:ankyrin repeat protein